MPKLSIAILVVCVTTTKIYHELQQYQEYYKKLKKNICMSRIFFYYIDFTQTIK